MLSTDLTTDLDLERPWLGLLSYEVQHEQLFFGREEEVTRLLDRVKSRPLTVLYGRSGLGKSSLLRAGLQPRLSDAGYLPIPLRLSYAENAVGPALQLRDALAGAVGETFPPQADLFLLLHDPVHGFCGEFPRHRPPVFLLDQFEEIFTSGQRRPGVATELLEALGILAENFRSRNLAAQLDADPALRERLDRRAHPSRVVLSLRDDFVYALDRWKRELPSLPDNRFELLPLNGPKAFRAVRQPGLLRDPQRPIVTEECALDIVRFVAGPPHDRQLEDISAVPPLLSLICSELNNRRLANGGEQIEPTFDKSTAHEILEAFYQRAFTGRPAALRELVEQRMVSSLGTRQPVNWDEAVARLTAPDFRKDQAQQLLADLVDERLFTVVDAGGLARIELTHDILCEVAVSSRARAEELATAQRAAAETAEAERRRQLADEEAERARRELAEKRRLLSTVSKLKKESDAARKKSDELVLERQRMLERETELLERTKTGYSALQRAYQRNRLLTRIVAVLVFGAAVLAWFAWSFARDKSLQELRVRLDREKFDELEVQAAQLRTEKEKLTKAFAEIAFANSQRDQTRAAQKIAEKEPGAAAEFFLRALESVPSNDAALIQLWFLLRYGPLGNGWALEKRIEAPGRTKQLSLNPAGRIIARQDSTGAITLWDLETGKLIRTLPASGDRFIFIGRGERLVVFNDETATWRYYDSETGELVSTTRAPVSGLGTVPYLSPDRLLGLTNLDNGGVVLSDMLNGREKLRLERVRLPYIGPYWRKDGSAFFVTSPPPGQQIQLRSVADGAALGPPFGPPLSRDYERDPFRETAFTSVVFGPARLDPSGQFLSLRTKTDKGNVTSVWKLDPAPKEIWKSPAGVVTGWHPSIGALIIRSESSQQYLDPRSPKPTLSDLPPPRHADFVLPEGTQTRIIDDSLGLIDRLSGDILMPPTAPESSEGVTAVSSRGDRVVEGGDVPALFVWNLPATRPTQWGVRPSTTRVATLRANAREIISPKGDWSAILPGSGPLRMSKLGGKANAVTFELPLLDVAEVSWSEDGEGLVVVYDDGRVQFFSWRPPRRWEPALIPWIQALGGHRITAAETVESREFGERLDWRARLAAAILEDPAWKKLQGWWLAGRPSDESRPSYTPSWVREPDPPPPSAPENELSPKQPPESPPIP